LNVRIYGLTGGIASGKSEAAQRFRARGIPVIDADKVGHAVIEPGGTAEARVIRAFGPEIVEDGRIDRRVLGTRVFADPRELERLNAIVQPAIKEEIHRQCEVLEAEGHDLAIIDAALLGEDGKIADWLDGLVLILAPDAVRLERLVALRGLSLEEAKRRIRAQTPPESKVPLATWVLNNGGGLEDFRTDVDALIDEIRAHRPGRRRSATHRRH
jgi:dephospho-CoA kinase